MSDDDDRVRHRPPNASAEDGAEDGEEGEDEAHGWESFVVWVTRSKTRPRRAALIDVSRVAHVMHSHQPSAHSHSSHPTPPSLAVIPAGTNESETARLMSRDEYTPNNPLAAPLSPGCADYQLTCADTASCALTSMEDAVVAELLTSRARDGQVVLLMVNAAYLPLAWDFVCRAAELRLTSYVFIAEDRRAYFALMARRVPVLLVRYARWEKAVAFASTNTSWLFDETMAYRSAVLDVAHNRLNLSVLVLHLDLVLFLNPLPTLRQQSTTHQCDVLVPLNASSPAGGIFYFPVTPLAHRLVSELRVCEEDNVLFGHLHSGNRFTFSDDKSASCLSAITTRLTRRNRFRRCAFSPYTYAVESDFFAWQRPQHYGLWPVAVHLDGQRSVEGKAKAISEWGMQAWDAQAEPDVVWVERDERLMHPRALWEEAERAKWPAGYRWDALVGCRPGHGANDPRGVGTGAVSGDWTIHVHVLGSAAAESTLESTVRSVMATVPARSMSVHLHVDVHSVTSAADPLLSRLRSLQCHGRPISVRAVPGPVVVGAEWAEGWPEVAEADGHSNAALAVLPLSAGQLLSVHAFTFLSSLFASHAPLLDAHLIAVACSTCPSSWARRPPTATARAPPRSCCPPPRGCSATSCRRSPAPCSSSPRSFTYCRGTASMRLPQGTPSRPRTRACRRCARTWGTYPHHRSTSSSGCTATPSSSATTPCILVCSTATAARRRPCWPWTTRRCRGCPRGWCCWPASCPLTGWT